MRTLLRIANVFLLLGMIACCAGAVAGLIVFLPVVAGAWGLNLVGLLGYEEAARHEDLAPARTAAAADTRVAEPRRSRQEPWQGVAELHSAEG